MHQLSIYIFIVSLMISPISFAKDNSRLTRIVNGEPVTQIQYPWMVEVRENTDGDFSLICGGSVIHPSWVLTAAHCIADLETGAANPIENYEIRLNNLNLAQQGGQIVKLKQIVLPDPSFNPETLEADIALLELAEPVDQTPVTLLDQAATPIPAGTQAMLTGWGRLAEPLANYLTAVYSNDPRVQDLPEPQAGEDENPLMVIVNTLLSVDSISNPEVLKVALAAPQIGLKTPYDDVTAFLDKVIVEGTVGFRALATEFEQDINISFEQLVQVVAAQDVPVVELVGFLDQVYDYTQGQLQRLYYPIVPLEICVTSGLIDAETEQQFNTLIASLICAGFEQGGKSNCNGDSGGPLTIWNGELGQWTQIGLVSYSSVCSIRGSYDVYTRVSYYTDFIKQYVPEAAFVTLNYQDMSQCDQTLTPVPFAPVFDLNQQQQYAKLFWEASSYAQEYVFTFAPYSNPISNLTFDNIQAINLDTSKTIFDINLPENSDYYVTVQAKNCAGLSEYAPIKRLTYTP